MIGLIMGLLGAGAIGLGSAIGSAVRPPDPPRSNPYRVSSGSGLGYGYYDYTPPSHSSSGNGSGGSEGQVFQFDKKTGELEVL